MMSVSDHYYTHRYTYMSHMKNRKQYN